MRPPMYRAARSALLQRVCAKPCLPWPVKEHPPYADAAPMRFGRPVAPALHARTRGILALVACAVALAGWLVPAHAARAEGIGAQLSDLDTQIHTTSDQLNAGRDAARATGPDAPSPGRVRPARAFVRAQFAARCGRGTAHRAERRGKPAVDGINRAPGTVRDAAGSGGRCTNSGLGCTICCRDPADRTRRSHCDSRCNTRDTRGRRRDRSRGVHRRRRNERHPQHARQSAGGRHARCHPDPRQRNRACVHHYGRRSDHHHGTVARSRPRRAVRALTARRPLPVGRKRSVHWIRLLRSHAVGLRAGGRDLAARHLRAVEYRPSRRSGAARARRPRVSSTISVTSVCTSVTV